MVFLIKIGPNNYLKVTYVDRNEPRGFYRNSKLTTFWEFRHFWSFIEPNFKINNFKNNIFRIISIRAFDWCMNCHICVKIFFFIFLNKRGALTKKKQKFFFLKNDNSYPNRMPLLSLFETCCYEKYI